MTPLWIAVALLALLLLASIAWTLSRIARLLRELYRDYEKFVDGENE